MVNVKSKIIILETSLGEGQVPGQGQCQGQSPGQVKSSHLLEVGFPVFYIGF